MRKIDPLAKMLGEGVVEMRRRLEAAEGKADELQRKLNVSAFHLERALGALREAEEMLSPPAHPDWIANGALGSMFRHGPDAEEALAIIREALAEVEGAQ